MAYKPPMVPASKYYLPRRLPKSLEAALARRATAQAASVYGPVLAGLTKERKMIGRTFRTTKSKLRKSLGAEVAAVKGESLKGLHGPARRQLKYTIAHDAAYTAKSLPSLLSSARSTKASSLLSLQKEIIGAQSQISEDAGRRLASLENTAYRDAHTYLKDKADQRATGRQHARKRARNYAKQVAHHEHQLNEAVLLGHTLLDTMPKKGPGSVPWSPDAVKHYGSANAAWEAFTRELLSQQGVNSIGLATRATHKIRHQIADELLTSLAGPTSLSPAIGGLLGHLLGG